MLRPRVFGSSQRSLRGSRCETLEIDAGPAARRIRAPALAARAVLAHRTNRHREFKRQRIWVDDQALILPSARLAASRSNRLASNWPPDHSR